MSYRDLCPECRERPKATNCETCGSIGYIKDEKPKWDDHPGWKRGGIVIRRTGQSFFLTDNGSYSIRRHAWFFSSMSGDAIGLNWEITPRNGDIYFPPLTEPPERSRHMISRNWIVVSSLNGPSSTPMKHTSEESAIEEAKRLALKNPSAQFYVYELRRAYQVETVREIEVSEYSVLTRKREQK